MANQGSNENYRQFLTGLAAVLRRSLACALIYFMVPLGMGNLYAQEAPPPPPYQMDQQPPPPPDEQMDEGQPPQPYNPLNADQLDQLVAPIALYPDALVAQVLAAATFPTQVSEADNWLHGNEGLPPDQIAQMANTMPWDPSVKSLTAFPSILSNLDRNLTWTTQLGNAYYNQPQDVMNAVQYMRQEAYQSGHLRSTPQEYVTYAPGAIVIAPASPAVVYVPYYDPWVVYGPAIRPWYYYSAPPPPVGLVFGAGVAIGFGVGVAVGVFGHWGWGWNHWAPDWHSRAIVYNHYTYVSRSVTVVNHGYYGHFDRSPEARAYNHNLAVHAVAYNRASFNNHVTVNNFNRGPQQNFNRGAAPNNFNRPVQNYSRPSGQQNFNRPQQNYSRPGGQQNFNSPQQNYNRPGGQPNFNRPQQNYSRPGGQQNFNRPGGADHQNAPSYGQSHPSGNPHPQNRPSGDHEDHPHGR